MKTIILTILLSAAAIAFAGCQTATNTANTNANTRANTAVVQNSNANSMMNMNGNSMMNGNSNMSGMSGMSDMKSSPDAASQSYDLQFLDTMSAHHQSAIDMAETAVKKTQNQELKAFAQKIIADQNKEIAQMKDWREKWYAGKPMAMNMEMPGMSDSMNNDVGRRNEKNGSGDRQGFRHPFSRYDDTASSGRDRDGERGFDQSRTPGNQHAGESNHQSAGI